MPYSNPEQQRACMADLLRCRRESGRWRTCRGSAGVRGAGLTGASAVILT